MGKIIRYILGFYGKSNEIDFVPLNMQYPPHLIFFT